MELRVAVEMRKKKSTIGRIISHPNETGNFCAASSKVPAIGINPRRRLISTFLLPYRRSRNWELHGGRETVIFDSPEGSSIKKFSVSRFSRYLPRPYEALTAFYVYGCGAIFAICGRPEGL